MNAKECAWLRHVRNARDVARYGRRQLSLFQAIRIAFRRVVGGTECYSPINPAHTICERDLRVINWTTKFGRRLSCIWLSSCRTKRRCFHRPSILHSPQTSALPLTVSATTPLWIAGQTFPILPSPLPPSHYPVSRREHKSFSSRPSIPRSSCTATTSVNRWTICLRKPQTTPVRNPRPTPPAISFATRPKNPPTTRLRNNRLPRIRNR